MEECWWLRHVSLTVVALMFMTPEASAHPDQGQKVLEEKVRQLMDWTKRDRVMRMNTAAFNHFVLEKPRNYSVIAMFTALQRFRSCAPCKLAVEEFQVLAGSWQFSSAFSNKVFFAMLDFDESPEVFKTLQVKGGPVVLHLPAKSEFTADDIYNFQVRDISAQHMFTWVDDRTGRWMGNFTTRQPIHFHYPFKLGISVALIGGLVYVLKWKRTFIFSKNFWAVLALCFVILMSSGRMWIHIRGAPFAESKTHTGQTHYIQDTYFFQYVAEMYIISLFYMCITLGMVLLSTAATSRMNIIRRKIMSVTGMCLLVIFFSWLLSLVRLKYHVYPFRILMN
ncbi:magnesium transporter protein 1-like [Bos javanicus]|uniref:Magnesium transporter protein 1 n=1 Tax=Bos indicus x Bos taurus TaxID=30522 RepID=A0A4W2H527_BOBOX|nr:magnesium transporter protein 1-like [Bos javanicus]XP_061268521.1 magnesium transporter protein 1-like [Bos javanicus]XP_061268522.1 magnesium transporter protein 1-like [Bos javanicus]DAA31113.1 TPA: magnesium transporter 1-like protein [Bos taurus]